MNAQNIPEKKFAYSVEDAAIVADLSRTALYAAIQRGELIARKNGRRTVVLADDLKLYLQQLPVIAG